MMTDKERIAKLEKENKDLSNTLAFYVTADNYNNNDILNKIDLLKNITSLNSLIEDLNEYKKEYEILVEVLKTEVENIKKDKEFLETEYKNVIKNNEYISKL